MPGGLLSAISGILAGGVLDFGAAVNLRKILPSGLVFLCLVTVQDLVIHWHISCQTHWSSRGQCLFRWVLGVLLAVFVLFWCFSLFVWPDMTSDCV